jgi:tetratricopeptide (TPR) repeat protein
MRARFAVPVLLSIVPVALVAAAQPKPKPKQSLPVPAASASAEKGPQGQPIDPKGQTGISPYMIKILKGNSAYTARDFPGAIAAYRDAIQDDAENPLGHYMLGEAQLAAGNLAEAEASWNAGLRYVGDRDALHAKLLFVLADLRERQGKWADAKKAWDEYSAFCGSHPNANGYAATATERNKTIDTHTDLETKYAVVKQRIEQRLKENGAPPPDSTPGKAPANAKKK